MGHEREREQEMRSMAARDANTSYEAVLLSRRKREEFWLLTNADSESTGVEVTSVHNLPVVVARDFGAKLSPRPGRLVVVCLKDSGKREHGNDDRHSR